MQYESFIANDGTHIAFQSSIATSQEGPASGAPKTCILLLHGFSGASEYFQKNMLALSEQHWVIAPDMRGHGRSQHTRHGYHVARLATDLRELVTHVIRATHPAVHIYAVGCSIGAAILWTYTELFSDADFAGLVFVDQAPLQNRSVVDNWGAGLAHYSCYDEATTLEAQRCWASVDPSIRRSTHVGLVTACLGYRYAPSPTDSVSADQQKADEDFFVDISATCDGVWLARLLADHTSYDHREAIELIAKPVLVMAGRRSGCFSVPSMMEIARRANANKHRLGAALGTVVVFESGHWLFWEESKRFNQELSDFVQRCEDAAART